MRLDERHWLEAGALYRIDGSGAVEVEVAQSARLALELDDIEMGEATPQPSPAASARPLLGGEGFRLVLETPALRLYAPPDELQRADLHWRNAEAFDIAALQRYLPPPVPLTLEGARPGCKADSATMPSTSPAVSISMARPSRCASGSSR
ncbi:hypothetical protein [Halomonas sp. E19]|uniref:hypothetical protein n=1 Tax=Halomonas sp. E19 TaxID=3397247 RepID=UPI0040337668